MLMLNCLHWNVQIIGHCWVPLIRDVYEEWCVYSMGYTWANTQRNKHVIIRSKRRYGIIITCSSLCVGWVARTEPVQMNWQGIESNTRDLAMRGRTELLQSTLMHVIYAL